MCINPSLRLKFKFNSSASFFPGTFPGSVGGGGILQSFIQGGSAPRSNPTTFSGTVTLPYKLNWKKGTRCTCFRNRPLSRINRPSRQSCHVHVLISIKFLHASRCIGPTWYHRGLLWVQFFSVIWISDALRSWCIEGSVESTLVTDFDFDFVIMDHGSWSWSPQRNKAFISFSKLYSQFTFHSGFTPLPFNWESASACTGRRRSSYFGWSRNAFLSKWDESLRDHPNQ